MRKTKMQIRAVLPAVFLSICLISSFAYGAKIGDLVYRDSEGRMTEEEWEVGRDKGGTGHVGIVSEVDENGVPTKVVDATLKHGVAERTFEEFKEGGNYLGSKTTAPEPSDQQRQDIVKFARDQIGRPYDRNHDNQKGEDRDGDERRDEFDCVGLAEAAYESVILKDEQGNPILDKEGNFIHPLNPTPDELEGSPPLGDRLLPFEQMTSPNMQEEFDQTLPTATLPGNDYPDDFAGVIGSSTYQGRALLESINLDISVLLRGCYRDCYYLMGGTNIISPDSSLSRMQDYPVLILPSGGLYGLDSSDIFKVKLAEYVRAGGTLICLSQQHGYEFNALPGGEVSGYGWLEDQSCHSNAAYIDTYHQILSGQTQTTPDLSVDGYFTSYPDDTTVLLRRTANGQPCMIIYPYGQGRVIATTMYEDWAYGQAQSTQDGRNLIRDLIAWAKEPQELPEYSPGDTLSLQLTANSLQSTEGEATQVELYILNPEREIVDST